MQTLSCWLGTTDKLTGAQGCGGELEPHTEKGRKVGAKVGVGGCSSLPVNLLQAVGKAAEKALGLGDGGGAGMEQRLVSC